MSLRSHLRSRSWLDERIQSTARAPASSSRAARRSGSDSRLWIDRDLAEGASSGGSLGGRDELRMVWRTSHHDSSRSAACRRRGRGRSRSHSRRAMPTTRPGALPMADDVCGEQSRARSSRLLRWRARSRAHHRRLRVRAYHDPCRYAGSHGRRRGFRGDTACAGRELSRIPSGSESGL
jgi:hypothetical protein